MPKSCQGFLPVYHFHLPLKIATIFYCQRKLSFSTIFHLPLLSLSTALVTCYLTSFLYIFTIIYSLLPIYFSILLFSPAGFCLFSLIAFPPKVFYDLFFSCRDLCFLPLLLLFLPFLLYAFSLSFIFSPRGSVSSYRFFLPLVIPRHGFFLSCFLCDLLPRPIAICVLCNLHFICRYLHAFLVASIICYVLCYKL